MKHFLFNRTVIVLFVILILIAIASFFAWRYESQFGFPPDFCRDIDGIYAIPFWESPFDCKVYNISQVIIFPIVFAAFFVGGSNSIWMAIIIVILSLYILALILSLPIKIIRRLFKSK